MKMNLIVRSLTLALTLSVLSAVTAQAQSLILDLKAENYSVATTGTVGGVWVDSSSSGNDATAYAYYVSPGYLANATPNGSPAVNFSYNGYAQADQPTTKKALSLTTPLTTAAFTTAPNFTIMALAYVPADFTGNSVIFGGSAANNIAYRVGSDGTQTLSLSGVSNVGSSTGTTYVNGTWAMFTVTYSSGSYAFYLNDELVGSGTSNKTFSVPTDSMITGTYSASATTMQMAAVQVYEGALNSTQVGDLYNTMYSTYLIPEPSTGLLAAFGLAAMTLARRNRRRA